MKLWKSSMLIMGVAVLLLLSMIASADESVTDGTGDIYHWAWNADVGTYNWQIATDDKPNIDITGLSFDINGDTATFTMTVDGSIEDSEVTNYWSTYTSDENITYFYTYNNGQVIGMASNTETTMFDMEADFTVTDSTLTVMFDSVGEGTTDIEFYGYAHTWTETSGESGESWWDYAPDTYFEGDIDVGDDEDATDEDDDDDGGTPSEPSTPGFEMIVVLAAIALAFIILRRKK